MTPLNLTTAGLVAVACLGSFFPSVATAQTATITRVEEDWELVVGEPDANSVSPQLTCVFAPSGNSNSLTGVFELNHRSQPQFTAGGLHLHVWNGETPLTTRSSPARNTMAKTDETVRWTQSMTLVSGQLVLEVLNGTSTTWGAFGNEGNLKITEPTSLTNMNGYSVDFSVANSGVGYAANRVKLLVIKRVRSISDDGEVFLDPRARTVFPNE